ncbi:MAG: isopeptide-forming domain-containing fimbrial protein [Solobacterium sp.]|nr:isopeptide-forming domain-containing fimbrial protein [Solobacterium sp.]
MNWKKAFLCTAALLAAMPLAAGKEVYADEMDENSTFTITVNNTPAGHTYAAYRVFAARADSTGTLSDIYWGEGVDPDRAISELKADSFRYKDKFASVVNGADAAAVISANQADADFIREVSAVFVKCRAVKAADEDPAGNVLRLTGAGWYLTLDETDLSGQNDARSAALIFTSQETLTIDPKIDLPTLEKLIIDEGTRGKTGDASVNEALKYHLVCTLPDNYADYESYELHFFDTSSGIRYDADSFYVSADQELLDIQPVIDGNSMRIDIPDLKALTDKDLSGKTVLVEYKGIVTSDAVIGSEGNPNTCYITYSNDPYGTQTGRSADEKAVFYTYKIEVVKVDEDNNPLPGASFVLRKLEAMRGSTVIEPVVSDDGTVFTFAGIGSGQYLLREVNTPDGYNTMEPIEVNISGVHDGADGTFTLHSLTCKAGDETIEGTVADGRIVLTAVNQKGVVLPSTGGSGTYVLYAAGIAMLIAGCLLMQRKHERE